MTHNKHSSKKYINLIYQSDYETPYQNPSKWINLQFLLELVGRTISLTTITKLIKNHQLGRWTKFRRKLFLYAEDLEIAKAKISEFNKNEVK